MVVQPGLWTWSGTPKAGFLATHPFSAGDVQLERCTALIKSNPAAARQLFKYASEVMSIDNIGN